MNEDNKGVETKTVVAPTQSEVDLAKELEETRAALAKKTADADNYKKGMLIAKGKLPVESQDGEADETMDDKIRRIAREEAANSEIAQLQLKEKETTDKILKRNRELELALKNRGQISDTSSQGSNQDKPEGKTDNYLSNDQLAALKAKGWDDKKIEAFKKNAQKTKL